MKSTRKVLIPKILFQTAKSHSGLSNELRENVAKLKQLNPDWDCRFYDDSAMRDYIRTRVTADAWQAVSLVNPKYGVVLADLFRYLAIYHEGGVYLDVKSTADQPLSRVLDSDASFILSQWPNKLGQPYEGWGSHAETAEVPGGEFQQWHVIAAPGHPFLKAAIQKTLHNIRTYTPRRFGTDALSVWRVSGPIAYTQAIYPLLLHCPYTITDIDKLGIHYSIFGDDAASQDFRSKVPGHYSTVKEPIVLKDVYFEAKQPFMGSLGEMLANEVRENVDFVLKLAVLSFISSISILLTLLLIILYLVV